MTEPSAAARHQDRYARDPSRPTAGQVWHDLWRRALVPGAGLLGLITVVGLVIVGPLGDLPAEDQINEWLAARRTPTLDAAAVALSTIGTTEFIIGGCLLAIGVTWWRTRQWWFAVIPGVAVAVQAAVFILAALVVGRDRPDVDQLEAAPPTSSFPSGHTGASVAFYLTVALLAQRIRPGWLRAPVTVACVAVPVMVGAARLYMGMHHVTDVLLGAVNGGACVWLAWHYLRRDPPQTAAYLERANE